MPVMQFIGISNTPLIEHDGGGKCCSPLGNKGSTANDDNPSFLGAT